MPLCRTAAARQHATVVLQFRAFYVFSSQLFVLDFSSQFAKKRIYACHIFERSCLVSLREFLITIIVNICDLVFAFM